MGSLDLTSLTAFDWALVALIAVSVVSAFFRGIIRVLFSIAGLVVGVIAASWNYPRLSAILLPWITSHVWSDVVSFLVIVAAIVLASFLVGSALSRMASAVGLGFFDRILGALFGLLRGALIAILVVTAIAAFLPESPWIRDSRLAPYFLAGTHAVSFVVPESFSQQISAGATRLFEHPPARFDNEDQHDTKKHRTAASATAKRGE